MANYSKAFNFRGGFQVDTDVLVVRGEQVGIGSTIPQQVLDVNGIIRAKGLEVDADEGVDIDRGSIGVLTVTEQLYVGVSTLDNHGTIIAIGTGIITATNESIGLVTYYGDGRFLQGLPTSQWLDIDIGLGYTSIYAQGNVGVDTIDPRYAFQVGGVPFVIPAGVGTVPFRFNQEGVGIESGNVYVSDDIRVGGGISVSGTIGVGQSINVDGDIGISSNLTVVGFVSAYEFIGIGSLITVINADNIAIGSIGSMRYGDTIVTKEVYADRFIGTATMAEDLVPEAQIDIDIARANEVDAITRFISTEGKLQIGSDELVTTVSDIDLFRVGSATISGVSSSSSARVFVGNERPTIGNRQYGGIRFGGDTSDPTSLANDFDVVNYDVGNLNYYLHSGQGGGTIGEFRWIYGQTDRILASLNKEGRLSLFGNSVSGNINLSVVGISTFEEIRAEEIAVGVGSVAGDFSIYGTLNVDSIGVTSDLSFEGAIFAGDVIVGADPLDSGVGVKIGADGVLSVSNNINLVNNGIQVIGMDPSGSITADGSISAGGDVTSGGSISATGSIAGAAVSALTLTASTSLSGPSLTNTGNLTSVDELSVASSADIFDLSAGVIDSPSATIDIIETSLIGFGTGPTRIESDRITTNVLTVNTSIQGNLDFGGIAEFDEILVGNGVSIGGDISADAATFTSVITSDLGVDAISARSGVITFTSDIASNNNITAIGANFNNANINALTVGSLSAIGGILSINSVINSTQDITSTGIVSASSVVASDIDCTNFTVSQVSAASTGTTITVSNNLDARDARFDAVVVASTLQVPSDSIDMSFGTISFTVSGSNLQIGITTNNVTSTVDLTLS